MRRTTGAAGWPRARFSVGAVRIDWVFLTAEAALKEAEIGLIHVVVAVEIGSATIVAAGDSRALHAGPEKLQIAVIHVTIAVEIAGQAAGPAQRDRGRTGGVRSVAHRT